MKLRTAVLLAVLLVGGAVGCSDDSDPAADDVPDDTTSTIPEDPEVSDVTETTTGDTGAPEGVAVATADTDLGTVLVDGEGWVLYAFANDADGVSNCNAGCEEAWPPLEGDAVTTEDPLSAADFSVIERESGAQQLAFRGRALYRYAGDEAPGDTNGQGVGGVWSVMTTDGPAPI
jgi:predicted lipoprotein with Yx(FWY)xxD motif